MRVLAVVVALACGGCLDFDSLGGLYVPDAAGVDGGGVDAATKDMATPVDAAGRDAPPVDATDVDAPVVIADLTAADLAMPSCGASSWSRLDVPGGDTLNGLYAVSTTDVWATGFAGGIYHYDGASWTNLPFPSTNLYGAAAQAVGATGANDVYVAVSGYRDAQFSMAASALLRTTNHGATWDVLAVPSQQLTAIWGVAPNDAWVAGTGFLAQVHSSPSLSFTNDDPNGTGAYAYDGVWASSSTVVSAGGPKIYSSINGGTSWGAAVLPLAPDGSWGNAIWSPDGLDLFLVGAAGWIWHAAGKGWSMPTQPVPLPSNGGPTRFLRGVWGTSGSDVYVVGDSATLLHSSNDGATWVPEATGLCPGDAAPDLYAVHGTGATVFVAGQNGVVLRKP